MKKNHNLFIVFFISPPFCYLLMKMFISSTDGATSIQNNNQFNSFGSDDSKCRNHSRHPPTSF